MQLQQRINAFINLGREISALSADPESEVLQKTAANNGWFTTKNVQFALKNWSEALQADKLEKWMGAYDELSGNSKTVAIIMAGNIPLVGFHDFIAVLISGHKVLAKLSSNDSILLPYLAERLIEIAPGFKDRISFSEERLTDFDAVIATGSNNTARYFDYYFGKYPNIIRKNRNSVAVLDGNETSEELESLANDIFRYYGLGCRNVSKIFLPEGYDFDPFFNAMFSWKEVINESRYMNNYDYNKAVYLMSNIPLLDNEFMLLKEDTAYASPISVVYYEYYQNLDSLASRLAADQDQVQALVGHTDVSGIIPFGKAQTPQLWDYADGVDTVDFLLKLS